MNADETSQIAIYFTLNPDGTFRVEQRGVHYGSATLGDAVGYVADQLLDLQNRVA